MWTWYKRKYRWVVNGVTFSNLIRAKGTSFDGDSGGIAYKTYKTRNIPFGIIKGGSSTYVNYVSAGKILLSMGVIPY